MRWLRHFSEIFIEIYSKSFKCLLKINNFMHNATIQTGTMQVSQYFVQFVHSWTNNEDKFCLCTR